MFSYTYDKSSITTSLTGFLHNHFSHIQHHNTTVQSHAVSMVRPWIMWLREEGLWWEYMCVYVCVCKVRSKGGDRRLLKAEGFVCGSVNSQIFQQLTGCLISQGMSVQRKPTYASDNNSCVFLYMTSLLLLIVCTAIIKFDDILFLFQNELLQNIRL